MGNQQYNLDASEAIFFERQVESIKAKTYDVKYPNLKARSLIPVSFEAGPGAESITYYQYDEVGVAKIMNSYANTISRVDIKGKRFNSPVHVIEDGYGYNYWEIQTAAKAGLALEQRRANAARKAALQLENSIAFNGDSSYGLSGFFSNSNIPSAAAEADGTGATTTFSTKTADQILRDVGELISDISTVTLGVETANTVLFPTSIYGLLRRTRVGDTTETLLTMLKNNYPEITLWDWLNELETAGTGGTKMMVAYNRNPDVLTLEIPADFLQLPVQVKGLEYEIPCTQKIGGTLVYYPLACNFVYGI